MATIERYETAKGRRYQVRYRTPDRRQTKKRGFVTKRDAERFAATVEVAIDRGEYVQPSLARVTIGELGPRWLEQQRTHLKPSSFRPTEIAWRVHVEPRWGEVSLQRLSNDDIQDWVADLSSRRGATTVIRAFGVLASICGAAVRNRRLRSNPCDDVKLPRRKPKSPTYLTHAQVRDLAREAKDRAPIILVLAYTGIRWGEMVGLRVRDVNHERRRLSIVRNAVEVGNTVIVGTPKNHERRSVPYPELLADDLTAACKGRGRDEPLFTGPDNGLLRRTRSTASAGGWFSGAVHRAGLPHITPHDLRHTAASLAVQAGANVKAVQRMLGHKSAAMTLDIYADLFDEDLDAVATSLHEAAIAESASRIGQQKPEPQGRTIV